MVTLQTSPGEGKDDQFAIGVMPTGHLRIVLVGLLAAVVLVLLTAGTASAEHQTGNNSDEPDIDVTLDGKVYSDPPAGPELIGAMRTFTFNVTAKSRAPLVADANVTRLNFSSLGSDPAFNFTIAASELPTGWSVKESSSGFLVVSIPESDGGDHPDAIHVGETKTFKLALTSNTALNEAYKDYDIAVVGRNANNTQGLNLPCKSEDDDLQQCNLDKTRVNLRAVGVKSAAVTAPQGVVDDNTASTNQTIKVKVDYRNERDVEVKFKVNVSSEQDPTKEFVESAEKTVPAGTDGSVELSLPLAEKVGNRKLVVNLTGVQGANATLGFNLTSLNVKLAPLLANEESKIAISKGFITRQDEGTKTSVLTVTWENLPDHEPASDVKASLQVLLDGNDKTSTFEVRDGSNNVVQPGDFIPLPAANGGQSGSGQFKVTTTSNTEDGSYGLRVKFDFADANLEPGTRVTNQQIEEPKGALIVDSKDPTLTSPNSFSPVLNVEFKRGGAAEVAFDATSADDHRDKVEAVFTKPGVPELTFALTRDGTTNDYTRSLDLATLETLVAEAKLLGVYGVVLRATDQAGNRIEIPAQAGTWTINLRDTFPPAVTSPIEIRRQDNNALVSGSVAANTPLRFNATAKDEYKVKQVWLNATHESDSFDIPAGCALPCPGFAMTLESTANSGNNGSYKLENFRVSKPGLYTFRVRALDAAETEAGFPANDETFGPAVTLTFTSSVEFKFGELPKKTRSGEGSQAKPLVVDDARVFNNAGIEDTFLLKCFVKASNVTGVTDRSQCKVATAPDPLDGAFAVLVRNDTAGAPFLKELALQPDPQQVGNPVELTLVPPTTARPGHEASIEVHAVSKFDPKAASNVMLDLTVVQARGIRANHDKLAPGQALDFDARPGRNYTFLVNLTNLGNVPQRVGVQNVSFPLQWNVAYDSTDPRWNATGQDLSLDPIGSPGAGAKGQAKVTVSIPIGESAGSFDVKAKAVGLGSDGKVDAAIPSQELAFRFKVAPASITVGFPHFERWDNLVAQPCYIDQDADENYDPGEQVVLRKVSTVVPAADGDCGPVAANDLFLSGSSFGQKTTASGQKTRTFDVQASEGPVLAFQDLDGSGAWSKKDALYLLANAASARPVQIGDVRLTPHGPYLAGSVVADNDLDEVANNTKKTEMGPLGPAGRFVFWDLDGSDAFDNKDPLYACLHPFPGCFSGPLEPDEVRLTSFRDFAAGSLVGPQDPERVPDSWALYNDKAVETYVFEVVATITSASNKPGFPFGFIDAEVRVVAPNGTTLRFPMSIRGGQAAPGQDGEYKAVIRIEDHVGRFFPLDPLVGFRPPEVVARDRFTGDVVEESADPICIGPIRIELNSFTCPDTEPPVISEIKLEQNDEPLEKNPQTGRFEADFSPIVVSFTVEDDFEVGTGFVNVFFQEAGGSIVGTFKAKLVSGTPVLSGGQRVAKGTFEAVFDPPGILATAQGNYSLVVSARDAFGTISKALPEHIVEATLLDRAGPRVEALTMKGGGREAAGEGPLDVQVGTGVKLEARIVDNGDTSPGSNVDPASVKVFVNSSAGKTVFGGAMEGSPQNPALFTADVPGSALNDTGVFSVEIVMLDLQGRAGSFRASLRVAPTLAPLVEVATTVPRTGDTFFAGPNASLEFVVRDIDVDPAGVVVEVGTATNLSKVEAAISGGNGTLNVRVPLAQEGNFTVRVTATDASNLPGSLTISVVFDATKPRDLQFVASPAFQTFAGEGTTFQVKGTDTGSGIGRSTVSARLEGSTLNGTRVLENATQSFKLRDVLGTGLRQGRYVLSAVVRDRVGNEARIEEVTYTLDLTPPTIGPIVPTSPLSVTVTDTEAGVRSVQVAWGESQLALTSTFDLQAGPANAWTGEFPPAASGTVFFVVRATDLVGNSAEGRCGLGPCTLAFGDRPPFLSLKVTSDGRPVTGGSTVNGTVTIDWDAVDPEGAQVTVTIKVRTTQGERTLEEDATLPVPWDTTKEPDGSATITLAATDGRQSNSTTLNVVVSNLEVVVVERPPSIVKAGGSLALAFDLSHPSKTVKSAVAVVRAGTEREQVQLFDDGTHGDRTAKDGIWSATYTPRLKGAHTVDVQVTYDDNTQATKASVATFQAEGKGATPIAGLLPLLVVGALVIALGVFGVRRWR